MSGIRAQDSISTKSDISKLSLAQKLIQGHWINFKDPNCYISIYDDSIIHKFQFEDGSYTIGKYSFGISIHKSGEAAPGGNPDLKNWNGYYIQAWNDSGKIETFWTVAIFSLSNKYLRLYENGDDIYINR